jgi:DNA-binding transcriptional MerR regulator
MPYTVGRVAALAKVSVRTLHHYDALGLLRPSGRSEAGYRLYSDGDLERLQQVLLYRELGLPLDDIARLMNDPGFDRLEALVAQRAQVLAKLRRNKALLATIDKTILAGKGGTRMSKEEMFEVFGDFDPSAYEDEVRQRWGDMEAYRESARRTGRYAKQDWERIRDEGAANLAAMIDLFDARVAPDDPRAMDIAEEARLQIDRAFYPCSREMHVTLGQMYVTDPRFTACYDTHREGLACWFAAAIEANAARAAPVISTA